MVKVPISLFADEHIPEVLVSQLRKSGIDATSVYREDMKGSPDDEVLEKAISQDRALLTVDKDFVSGLEKKYDHRGIIKFKERYKIGEMLRDVQKVVSTLSEDEIKGTVIYLPW